LLVGGLPETPFAIMTSPPSMISSKVQFAINNVCPRYDPKVIEVGQIVAVIHRVRRLDVVGAGRVFHLIQFLNEIVRLRREKFVRFGSAPVYAVHPSGKDPESDGCRTLLYEVYCPFSTGPFVTLASP
jgi:hypothetical protein